MKTKLDGAIPGSLRFERWHVERIESDRRWSRLIAVLGLAVAIVGVLVTYFRR